MYFLLKLLPIKTVLMVAVIVLLAQLAGVDVVGWFGTTLLDQLTGAFGF